MNDDFDDNDLDLDDSSFDEFEEKDGSLGGKLKDNPLLKVGLIVFAIIAVFGIIMMFGGKSSTVDESYLGAAPDITTPPGTEASSQEYIEAIQEVNERDAHTD